MYIVVSIFPPGWIHTVLTTDATIMYGLHFYSGPLLPDSVRSMVHALFTDQYTTNRSNLAFFRVVLGFLPYWSLVLQQAAHDAESNAELDYSKHSTSSHIFDLIPLARRLYRMCSISCEARRYGDTRRRHQRGDILSSARAAIRVIYCGTVRR